MYTSRVPEKHVRKESEGGKHEAKHDAKREKMVKRMVEHHPQNAHLRRDIVLDRHVCDAHNDSQDTKHPGTSKVGVCIGDVKGTFHELVRVAPLLLEIQNLRKERRVGKDEKSGTRPGVFDRRTRYTHTE